MYYPTVPTRSTLMMLQRFVRPHDAPARCAALCLLAWLTVVSRVSVAVTDPYADTVYQHGYIYTVDARNSVYQALAERSGIIVYVGSDAGVQSLIGPQTRRIDLKSRMLMPGLIDGHMHPLAGGEALLGCDLQYARLTVAQMQARIQACLDATRAREPDGWLRVRNWFQEAMVGGTTTSRVTLDALHTKRPILVQSSFGHTALLNSRALELAKVTATTPDPKGGQIGRDPSGKPSGILQDAALELGERAVPPTSPADHVKAAQAALRALRAQGVTTFLDAAAGPESLAAFSAAEKAGGLTARAHFALLIKPTQSDDPEQAIADVRNLAARYDEGPIVPAPRITVRNIKLFLDGVITAPAMTGAMLEPYFVNDGTAEEPHWVPGQSRGPPVYFAAPVLKRIVLEAAAAGFEPHMHADGDRAVHEALDAVQALRQRFSATTIRAAIAHDEIVDPKDFVRYGPLGAVPVLSFQWEKPAPDTVDGARDYLGRARYRYVEPAAFLAAAGARIAYGSDWPVDALDEWFALKVGVTRTNRTDIDSQYRGRLSEDRGLSRDEVLRAITLNAAYELHQEESTGSLEPGKLADLIILDRNPLQIPAEDIAKVKVLRTVVGGHTVYAPSSDSSDALQ
jgi:predicted amidohydrolase YtcJ